MTSPLPVTAQRRAILAVGVPVTLALIALTASAWVHTAVRTLANLNEVGYSVAFSVPVSGGHVRVTSGAGDITVRAGTGNRIRVRGSLRGPLARPTFSHRLTAAGLALNSGCRAPVGNCSLEFAVTAPAGLPVNVGASFGQLDARALHGTVTLSDNSGDITASGLTGDIRLTDQFGNLTASGLAGTIRLRNNSGDITAAGLTGNTQLADGYGNISVTGVSATNVTCSNQSGDITLTFTKVPQRVNVTDSFGNITLNLPPGSPAYHVVTHNSYGNTTVTVPQATSSPYLITATDQSGDITIASQPGADPALPATPSRIVRSPRPARG